MSQLRLLKGGAILFLITAVSFFLLIFNGFFDPQPVGEVVWQHSFGTMTVPAKTKEIQWLAQPTSADDFSVRLTAQFVEGGLDTGYGLLVGDEHTHLIVAVSPLGYAFIQDNDSVIFPWQPWPHVHAEDESNEIWLNRVHGELTIRLNRELIWVGPVELVDGEIGLYAESFAETAVIDFTAIEISE